MLLLRLHSKLSCFFFLLIISCCSCATEVDEVDCNYLALFDTTLVVDFPDSNSISFDLSPFEHNKVLINFPVKSFEYDLSSKDKVGIPNDHWKKKSAGKFTVYEDKKDSIVWVGGQLLSYDQKQKTAKYYSLENVSRITAFQDRTYFVSSSGLYYKIDGIDSIIQVTDFPLSSIFSSQQLDSKTLIFNDSITYDLDTRRWTEGVYLHNMKLEKESCSFIAKNSIGVYKYRDWLSYITPDKTGRMISVNSSKINNASIHDRYLFFIQSKTISRFDFEKDTMITFKYLMPLGGNQHVNVSFDDDLIWLRLPGQVSFLDMQTKDQFIFKDFDDRQIIDFSFDDCYVYLLFEHQLIVYPKSHFINQCERFDKQKYKNELVYYNTFLDSIGLLRAQNIDSVIHKLSVVKTNFERSNNLDVRSKLSGLDRIAFNNLYLETKAELEQCYNSIQIPVYQRASCFKRLIRSEVHSRNFKRVMDIQSEYYNQGAHRIDLQNKYFMTNIDSIKKYIQVTDSLSNLSIAVDTIAYQKALSIESVCLTQFFCHEGCGGCDFTFLFEDLKEFISQYPNSPLVDNAEYLMITRTYAYHHDDLDHQFLIDLESFKNKYPDSEKLVDADFEIISYLFYINHTTGTKHRDRLVKFIQDYPSDRRINEVKNILANLSASRN